jgi:hypothetical protein
MLSNAEREAPTDSEPEPAGCPSAFSLWLFSLSEARHRPSWSVLEQANPAPDPGRRGPVSPTAMPFQLGKKCSAREGIALMVFLCPVLIGLPDLGRTAPGMRVQFTAGGEKCLERIMIGRKTLARFLRGEDCLLLVLATWVIHSKNRHLETEKDSLRWFANTGGLM